MKRPSTRIIAVKSISPRRQRQKIIPSQRACLPPLVLIKIPALRCLDTNHPYQIFGWPPWQSSSTATLIQVEQILPVMQTVKKHHSRTVDYRTKLLTYRSIYALQKGRVKRYIQDVVERYVVDGSPSLRPEQFHPYH